MYHSNRPYIEWFRTVSENIAGLTKIMFLIFNVVSLIRPNDCKGQYINTLTNAICYVYNL